MVKHNNSGIALFFDYGIISTDIIPAPVRVRPKGGHIQKRTVCIRQNAMSGGHDILKHSKSNTPQQAAGAWLNLK